MFRLISLLLLLAGLAAVGWGTYRYYNPAPDAAPATTEESAGEAAESSTAGTGPAPNMPMSLEMGENDTFGAASSSSATQAMLDRLRTVPIAHETPKQAKYNRAFEVTVALDATGDDTAADALPGEGNIVEGEAQVLDKAQATLSGRAFEIELVSPSIQTVSPVSENIWRWRVRPLETGTHQLRIELFALEGNEALPIRTFTDDVEVSVSRLGQVLATADQLDPVFMILGGAGSLLAGLFGFFRFMRGR